MSFLFLAFLFSFVVVATSSAFSGDCLIATGGLLLQRTLRLHSRLILVTITTVTDSWLPLKVKFVGVCLHYYAIKKNLLFKLLFNLKIKRALLLIIIISLRILRLPYTHLILIFILNRYFNESFMSFLANMSNIQEPSSYTNAKNDINWISAMQHSLMLLKQITTLPASKKAIGSEWIYKIKLKSDNAFDRLKIVLWLKITIK